MTSILETNQLSLSSNLVVNTDGIFLSDGVSNISANTTGLNISNSSANLVVVNSSAVYISNGATNSVSINTSGMFLNGTLTASINSVSMNSTSFALTNSGAYATAPSNGSLLLPGGFIMNWGYVSSTGTTGSVIFETPYQTNAFFVMATGSSNVLSTKPAVISWTNTGCIIETSNSTANNVYYFAIGV